MPEPPDPHKLNIEVECVADSLGIVLERLDHFSRFRGWPSEFVVAFRLAVEEFTLNALTHAGDRDGTGPLQLSIVDRGQTVLAELIDDAPAFNPLEVPPPSLDAELDDREPGGLGIFLARQMVDHISYRRDTGHNILSFSKSLRSNDA